MSAAIKEYMPISLAGRTKAMQVSLTSQSNAETFALGPKSFWNGAPRPCRHNRHNAADKDS